MEYEWDGTFCNACVFSNIGFPRSGVSNEKQRTEYGKKESPG